MEIITPLREIIDHYKNHLEAHLDIKVTKVEYFDFETQLTPREAAKINTIKFR